MEDFIKQFMSGKGADLVQSLVGKIGLSTDQAGTFVSTTVEKVLEVVKGGKLDLGAIASGNASELMNNVDVDDLAAKVGIDKEKAEEGLQTVVPSLVSAIQEKVGSGEGILELIGGKDKSGLLGAASGLAGKFFKK